MVLHPDRALARGALLALATVAVLTGLLLGCESERQAIRKPEDLVETLVKASTDFNNLLKWQAYEKMTPYILPEKREAFLLSLDRIEGRLNVEGIEIAQVVVLDLEPGSREANKKLAQQERKGRVVVKLINVTRAPSTQVTTFRFAEDWIFKGGDWYADFELAELLNLPYSPPRNLSTS